MERISEVLKETGRDITSESISKVDKMEEYYQTMCDFHNNTEGNLHLQDGYECPICKNKGYLWKPYKSEFGYWTEMQYPCKCQKVRETIRKMEKSGLSGVINKYKFTNFATDTEFQKMLYNKAATFTKNHLDNGGNNWFFIGGTSGCGKTHICTAICREFIKSGIQVKYMLWRDDVVKLKTHLTDFDEYGRMMNEYKNAEVLYVDDLFKTGKGASNDIQKPTSADVNLAFELLNYRYNNPDLITIISSECMINDILDIDEAVGGRIAEKAGEYSINIAPDRAKNYRLKGMVVV